MLKQAPKCEGRDAIARIWQRLFVLKEIHEIKEEVYRIKGTQQKCSLPKTKKIAAVDSLDTEEGILIICEDA